MADKWKQTFRDKFADYQPDIPVPAFQTTMVRRPSAKSGWIVAPLSLAAVVLSFLFLSNRHRTDETVQPHHIPETSAKVEIPGFPECTSLLTAMKHRKTDSPSNQLTENLQRPDTGQDQKDSTPADSKPSGQNVVSNDGNAERNTERNGNDLFTTSSSNQKDHPFELQISGMGSARMSSLSTLASTGVDNPGYLDTLTMVLFPVRACIALRYSLTDKIAIETGLNYGIYAALGRISEKDPGNIFHYHAIGIPLKIDYRIYGLNRFTGYAALGGEVAYVLEGGTTRFALTTALGFDYRLVPHLSLFAEPGLTWTFHKQGIIPYYYVKHHPLSFDLSVGLRFRLN